ncbi:hypothetical protein [Streptomyces regalis]|uniref:hypothetical protein n=1 Tax=Streptomyces regalis TaxID=68262 RepID=UPI000AC9E65A|nr:hypothetical protein [Streptomyces regalis]
MHPWPTKASAVIEHEHTDLHCGHPHLAGTTPSPAGWRHSHRYLTDALHAHQ